MCEYQIFEVKKSPKCKDGTLCLFCILGNSNKYKEIKYKEKERNKI